MKIGLIMQDFKFNINLNDFDFLIGVDRGALIAYQNNIYVNLAIGDFDSVTKDELILIQEKSKVIKLNPIKDLTDTAEALKYAFKLSNDVTMLGGIEGKRIEHFIANLCLFKEYPLLKIENENSRINIKILEETQETAINAKGPYIEEKYLELLYKKLERIEDKDTLVLSGSVPNGISNNIYETICQKLKNKNIKIVVDSTGELLLKTLKYKPYLIKPNQQELEEIFNTKIENKDQSLEYAKKLQEKGAQNVIISMGSKGAVLLDENGYSYKINALNTKDAINTVGAGDSMVAGFLAGHEMFNNYEKALQMGVAAATATTNSIFLATKEKIEENLKNFK